ncbi:hypothetical protein XENTR_v10022570 [Xenopus tropicalis]|nr:hypothetical protein XENTR_v10022570 [Xenopus tropicalis]
MTGACGRCAGEEYTLQLACLFVIYSLHHSVIKIHPCFVLQVLPGKVRLWRHFILLRCYISLTIGWVLEKLEQVGFSIGWGKSRC